MTCNCVVIQSISHEIQKFGERKENERTCSSWTRDGCRLKLRIGHFCYEGAQGMCATNFSTSFCLVHYELTAIRFQILENLAQGGGCASAHSPAYTLF